MAAYIQGMSWLTPLGSGLEDVWSRLLEGEAAKVAEIGKHFYIPLSPECQECVAALGKNPRLRRSSAISYFTAWAGKTALENAGVAGVNGGRIALVSAVSSGGVIYTRRFYEGIVEKGTASPLLFPETVYNAPASHLAALLGIDGVTYTLAGDSSVGISAIKLAAQLLETNQADHCLVVGAEEVDWVLCEAYRRWRLTTSKPEITLHAKHPAGALLAEGAAALVLGREGPVRLRRIHGGAPFFSRAGARAAISQVYSDLADGEISFVVGSANGSFVDNAEAAALGEKFPGAPVLSPKAALGDALGASALIQTVAGALALGKHPSVLVSSVGFNHQAAGLTLETS